MMSQLTQTPPDILPESFYAQPVHTVARGLIGCKVLHREVGGIIVETEAYNRHDPACHAYRGLTDRNQVMFGPPGRAYIYFTYGMHFLFNIVCEEEGEPAGVLIRAIEPTDGLEEMRQRRSPVGDLLQLANGPAKLTQALDINLNHYGRPVFSGDLQIFGRMPDWQNPKIIATPRIGIRVGTKRKWRYCAAGSKFLSRKLTRKELASETD